MSSQKYSANQHRIETLPYGQLNQIQALMRDLKSLIRTVS